MDRAHPLGKSVMHAAIPPSQDEAPAVATIAPSFSYPSLIMRRSQMAETRFVRHGIPCGCCGAELRSGFNRRRFMQIAGAGLAITLPSFFVVAAEGNYEAMVLTCIDPRIQEPVWKYLAGRDLTANTASLSSPVRPSASSLLPLRTGIRRSGTIRYVDSIAPYQESDCDRSPRLRRRQDCLR